MARAQVRAPAPDDQDQQAAGDDNEAPEAQGDSSDSPILDLSDAAVKRMIKLAKARGFVTLDELNAVLPSDETSPEQIEDIMAMLNEMGINVVESEEETENLTAKVEAEAERATAKAADAIAVLSSESLRCQRCCVSGSEGDDVDASLPRSRRSARGIWRSP